MGLLEIIRRLVRPELAACLMISIGMALRFNWATGEWDEVPDGSGPQAPELTPEQREANLRAAERVASGSSGTMADHPELIPGYGMTREQLRAAAAKQGPNGIGGADTAYNSGSDATRRAFDQYHDNNQGGVDWDAVLNTARDITNNPVVNPVGYGASKAGTLLDDQVGVNVSGYIQDPLGQGLADIGAPDAVQVVANPTGYVTRTAVNADTGYGTLPVEAGTNLVHGAGNVVNDANNTAGFVSDIPGKIADAVGGVGGGGSGGDLGPSQTNATRPGTATEADYLRAFQTQSDVTGAGAASQRLSDYEQQLAALANKPPSSVAEAQLRAGAAQAASAALGQARSGNRRDRAMLERQALAEGQFTMQEANRQAATLRAQEEDANRRFQADTLKGAANVAGGNVELNQEGLKIAQDLTNAPIDQQIAAFNAITADENFDDRTRLMAEELIRQGKINWQDVAFKTGDTLLRALGLFF